VLVTRALEPFTSRTPTRLGEIVTGGHSHGDRPIAVAITNLAKTYPVPFLRLKKFLRQIKTPVEALRNVSFNIHEGEIFGLIGLNGAGKTTLTKIIATLVQPTSGQVMVRVHDSVHDDEIVRRNVGLAGAEERSFYFRLTSEQNLWFFARLYGLATYGLDGIRRVLIGGQGFSQVREPLVTLLVFQAVLLPFSLWVFGRAVRRAKCEGSLIQY